MPSVFTVLRACLALLPLVLLPTAAHAWSSDGHRITGLVAEQLISGRTRRALTELVGDERLEDTAVWLDAERDAMRAAHPRSDRWHFDNRPVCDAAAPRERWCRDGDCASLALERARRVLADPRAAREQRVEALRIVVHLVGDIHQPLHAADDRDRGGNDVEIGPPRRGDRPRTLHGLWDGEFVRRAMRGDSLRGTAVRLVSERRDRIAALQAGDPGSWQQESYAVARELAYGRLPGWSCGRSPRALDRLPVEYRDAAADAVRERLARAGIRLARVLDDALGR